MRKSIFRFSLLLLMYVLVSCENGDSVNLIESYSVSWDKSLQDFEGRFPLGQFDDKFSHVMLINDEIIVVSELSVEKQGIEVVKLDGEGNILDSLNISGSSQIADVAIGEDGLINILLINLSYELYLIDVNLNVVDVLSFNVENRENETIFTNGVKLGNQFIYVQSGSFENETTFSLLKVDFTGQIVWQTEKLSNRILQDFNEFKNGDLWALSRETDDDVTVHNLLFVDDQGIIKNEIRIADSNNTNQNEATVIDFITKSEKSGFFVSGGNNDGNVFLSHISDNGQEIWSDVVDDYTSNQLADLMGVSDSGLITALNGDVNKGSTQFLLLKHDGKGNFGWQGNFFTFTGDTQSLKVVESSNGDLIVLTNYGNIYKLSPNQE